MREQESGGQRLSWPRPRFSIRTMLIATAIIAALFPAAWFIWFMLLNASTGWALAAFWLTAFILAVAIMLAVNRRGAARAYWAGFAAVGLIYFFIVPCDLPSDQRGNMCFDRENLVTVRASRFAYNEYVFPRMMRSLGNQPQFGMPAFSQGPGRPSQDDFINVAELLWTLLLAILGGWISLLIWATGRSDPPQRSDHEQRT